MDPKTAQRIIDCGPQPATPVVRKKPLAKKPKTEVVVQMGPFTDGNVSTPDSFENISGPKDLLIKPDTGEIGPFDPSKPVPDNVIRKYITVQAQDNDVPNDLPKSGSGDYILRELPAVVGLDADPDNNTITRVEYVRESYTTSTVTTQDPPPAVQEEDCPSCVCEEPVVEEPVVEEPVCEKPPVCDEPVVEEPDCEKPAVCDDPVVEEPVVEEPVCAPPPVCEEPPVAQPPVVQPPVVQPPAVEEPKCEEPVVEEPYCEQPVVCEESKCEELLDANNDMANTKQNTAVTIDVLKNDQGCDPLCITAAHADNGLVEILEGKLYYTPKTGFHGNDVINYTISDHGCLTDDANVFVNVTKTTTPTVPVVEGPKCEEPAVQECAKADEECVKPTDTCKPPAELACEPDAKNDSSDNVLCYEEDATESTVDSVSDSIFARTESLLDEIFSRASTVMEKAESTRTSWTEALDSSWSKASAVAACEDVALVA